MVNDAGEAKIINAKTTENSVVFHDGKYKLRVNHGVQQKVSLTTVWWNKRMNNPVSLSNAVFKFVVLQPLQC